jgi:beta-phosphoglucomutase-like phosphatase (HAD superfamily)
LDSSAADPGRPAPPTAQAPGLDEIAVRWWAALEAAGAALRSAGHDLGSQEARERTRLLAVERSETTQLLQGLAHDRHTAGWLLRWLAAPALTRRMLGLPDRVRACVFDLDGVLTTSATTHAAAWAETLDPFLLERAERSHRHFIPFDRRIEYQESFAGRPRLDGLSVFLAGRGMSLPDGTPDDAADAETMHGLANRKNQLMQQHLAQQGVAAFAGSRFYLEAARSIGVRLAVVSASANTGAILERAGLADLIDESIDGNTIEAEALRPKPAPDTIAFACRLLGVEAYQLAAFETTLAGIAAARGAGAELTVGVDRSGHTEALLASDADLVISDLSELLDRALGG